MSDPQGESSPRTPPETGRALFSWLKRLFGARFLGLGTSAVEASGIPQGRTQPAMRIGILTEFLTESVHSGPAIQTHFLKQGLERRGHEVVLMGPKGALSESDASPGVHSCAGVPWPTHPDVRVPMPGLSVRHLLNPPRVDLIHSQTNSHLSDYAHWIRRMWRVPVLNTHTVHMPTHSHFLLSDSLYASAAIRARCHRAAEEAERRFARLYNGGDCLIVQNRFLVEHWRERGVSVPIEVVGRPIDPARFDPREGRDPYPEAFSRGQRFLVVCRHDREKRLDHLIELFSSRILPRNPEATLTLIGDGHAHERLVQQAQKSSAPARIHFTGALPHTSLVGWYRHGDVFVYTSLSETFGNVINEALWCGMPVVALDDQMGVAHQVREGVNGVLIPPQRAETDHDFADACLRLVREKGRLEAMSMAAERGARDVSHPERVIKRFEALYDQAERHCRERISRPLSEASRGAQLRAFAAHVSRWAWWHATILGIAYTATRLGLSREAHGGVVGRGMTEPAARVHAPL